MDETNPSGAPGHEVSDVNVRAISKFGIGLTFGVVVVSFLMWFLFDRFAKGEADRMSRPNPMVTLNPQKEPPEPRLQKTPPLDLEKFRAAEEEKIKSYGWVDPAKGVVRIPISRALDIVAQEGLTKEGKR